MSLADRLERVEVIKISDFRITVNLKDASRIGWEDRSQQQAFCFEFGN